MSNQTCVVKFTDSFGVEHSAKVEAESLFEAAIRGLYKLDSSFWTEENVFDQMLISIEVWETPTEHAVKVQKVKDWLKSHGRSPAQEAKKQELRKLLYGESKGQR